MPALTTFTTPTHSLPSNQDQSDSGKSKPDEGQYYNAEQVPVLLCCVQAEEICKEQDTAVLIARSSALSLRWPGKVQHNTNPSTLLPEPQQKPLGAWSTAWCWSGAGAMAKEAPAGSRAFAHSTRLPACSAGRSFLFQSNSTRSNLSLRCVTQFTANCLIAAMLLFTCRCY